MLLRHILRSRGYFKRGWLRKYVSRLGHSDAAHGETTKHGDEAGKNPYNWRINNYLNFQHPWDWTYSDEKEVRYFYRCNPADFDPKKDYFDKWSWISDEIMMRLLVGIFWGTAILYFIESPETLAPEAWFPNRHFLRKNLDVSKWTDEELGIPPDEEGLAPLKANIKRTTAFGWEDVRHETGPRYAYTFSHGETHGQFDF